MTRLEIFEHFARETAPRPHTPKIGKLVAKYRRARDLEDARKSNDTFRETVAIARSRKANPPPRAQPPAEAAAHRCECGQAYGSAHGLRAHRVRAHR